VYKRQEKNKHAADRKGGTQGGAGKAVVFGVLKRDGEFRAFHMPNLQGRNVGAAVRANVAEGANLFTDEHRSFNGLDGQYNHHRTNHSAGQYVVDFFNHTNGIEGAWSLIKRQIYGIHHWVSPKHLSRYLDEMTWRYNRRDQDEDVRVNDLLGQVAGRLRYKELIA